MTATITTDEALKLLNDAIDRTKKIGDEELHSAIHETMRKVAEGMEQTAEFFKAADGEQALLAYAKIVRAIADLIETGGHGALQNIDAPKVAAEIMNTGTTQF